VDAHVSFSWAPGEGSLQSSREPGGSPQFIVRLFSKSFRVLVTKLPFDLANSGIEIMSGLRVVFIARRGCLMFLFIAVPCTFLW